jgi:hypothetical protein
MGQCIKRNPLCPNRRAARSPEPDRLKAHALCQFPAGPLIGDNPIGGSSNPSLNANYRREKASANPLYAAAMNHGLAPRSLATKLHSAAS